MFKNSLNWGVSHTRPGISRSPWPTVISGGEWADRNVVIQRAEFLAVRMTEKVLREKED